MSTTMVGCLHTLRNAHHNTMLTFLQTSQVLWHTHNFEWGMEPRPPLAFIESLRIPFILPAEEPSQIELITVFLSILRTCAGNCLLAFTFLSFPHFTTSPVISRCPESQFLWTGAMSHSPADAQNRTQSPAQKKVLSTYRREENNTKGKKESRRE